MRRILGFGAAVAVAAVFVLGTAMPAHADSPVATISGCYDCLAFDTPSLIFNNTTGGSLTNAQMVLTGYQGDNLGQTATVSLGTLGGGSTDFTWGSLPGVSSSTTPYNLTASDYDDEFNVGTGSPLWLGGAYPNCNAPGDTDSQGSCVGGGGATWYAQTGNFSVTFTATVSGGLYDGQSVYSVFSPTDNATGGFVGWEGIDQAGYSENPLYDDHSGSLTGTLANIDLGTVPTPEPEALSILSIYAGLGLFGIALWRKTGPIKQ